MHLYRERKGGLRDEYLRLSLRTELFSEWHVLVSNGPVKWLSIGTDRFQDTSGKDNEPWETNEEMEMKEGKERRLVFSPSFSIPFRDNCLIRILYD